MMGIPEPDYRRIVNRTNVVMGFGDPDIPDDIGEVRTATKNLAEYGQVLSQNRGATGRTI
jgi:hypothetical protein